MQRLKADPALSRTGLESNSVNLVVNDSRLCQDPSSVLPLRRTREEDSLYLPDNDNGSISFVIRAARIGEYLSFGGKCPNPSYFGVSVVWDTNVHQEQRAKLHLGPRFAIFCPFNKGRRFARAILKQLKMFMVQWLHLLSSKAQVELPPNWIRCQKKSPEQKVQSEEHPPSLLGLSMSTNHN
jgi:hypothetical protein